MARTIPVQQHLVQLTFQLILINRHLYNVPIEPLWTGFIELKSSRKAQKSQPLGLAFFISDHETGIITLHRLRSISLQFSA